MDLFDSNLAALEKALTGSAQRQQTIANNIANVNTPGFKRSDVDFMSTLHAALASGASPQQIEQLKFSTQTDTASAMRSDGNNVDIDQEMADMTQNSTEYQMLAAIMHARLQMIQGAIGSR